MLKPFKPPTILGRNQNDKRQDNAGPPPAKKARFESKTPAKQLWPENRGVDTKSSQSVETPPKASSGDINLAVKEPQNANAELDKYFSVLWRKFSTKKNKTWDGDGIVRLSGSYVCLEDIGGKEMGRAQCPATFGVETAMSIGGREVLVESVLSRDEFVSMRKPKSPPLRKTLALLGSSPKAQRKQDFKRPKGELKVADQDPARPLNIEAPRTQATSFKFKSPMAEQTFQPKYTGPLPVPRHDPSAPDALIMKRPAKVPGGKAVVDVVVDPVLSKHLRAHQRDGVQFLYECVMGLRDYGGQGAILADQMGLGKTLQTIALVWTLLKQNPIYEEAPVIKKALIVCPATLLNNWKKEFRKWLGLERIGVFVYDDSKKRITDFTKGRAYSVMIIGYEKLRSNIDELQKGQSIDIVIADEGHRLKTQQNKSGTAIRSLQTPKRILLSGTPIQNDLSEFYSMVDFVNPGVLGSVKSFVKSYELPIERSRQPEATAEDIENGQYRSEELAQTTSSFILRRTADILSQYLPPKTEYILMCRPVPAQASVYRKILGSALFQSGLGNTEIHLQLIAVLKKICNSTRLLNADAAVDDGRLSFAQEIASTIPSSLLRTNSASTKIRVLDHLLNKIRSTTDEKVVLVSNSTACLDLLGGLLSSLSMPFLRLDGSTQTKQRQDLVDTFNRTPASSNFAFLLSAKAGGMGLNLIGASRLILFDIDWNPAIDAQAMARIHRDGQKRPCMIYRLLMAGGLDEKIWQRQITKIGLADSVMEQKSSASSFTKEELKALFRLDEGHACQTHELLGCPCKGQGIPDIAPVIEDADADQTDDDCIPPVPILQRSSEVDMEAQERKIQKFKAARRTRVSKNEMRSLFDYAHIDTSRFGSEQNEDMEAMVSDKVLLSVLKEEESNINFVFAKTSGTE